MKNKIQLLIFLSTFLFMVSCSLDNSSSDTDSNTGGGGIPTSVTTSSTTYTIGSISVTLNGQANPNNLATSGYFRYSEIDPGTGNDTDGTATGSTSLGTGANTVAYSQVVTNLKAVTTYYYWAIASNASGKTYGSVQSFTTSVTLIGNATSVTSTTATLHGLGNPNGNAMTGWFRYSTNNPGTGNDTSGTRQPGGAGTLSLGSGTVSTNFQYAISNPLSSGTTYYYLAITNGNSGITCGAVQTFTTP
ncbi:MAG: hypothetical protein JW982_04620 [Spirochaetes bacterium]|nr:hypothetical protein [Spirochaetota bacterium]